MNIGAHVSIAGSIANAPVNAERAACECFQMFSRPPQGGPAPVLDDKIVAQFTANMKKHRQAAAYIHTPYYINLASSSPKIRYGSIKVIRDELDRASLLGARAVMTHLGSSKDLGKAQALKKVIEGVGKILDGYTGSAQFLIENSAGAGGTIIGDTFDEIGAIIKAYPRIHIGVCFDTCHAFVSGYDVREKAAVAKTLKAFDKAIGLEKLQLVHANDAKAELGSRSDRHEHIGNGMIGIDGFRALIGAARIHDVDWILETPKDDSDADDMRTLKGIRQSL
ncbi:MAG: deoxyribonuclease IV [Patescibacteria group bacterium]|nr:deoxyribonuclease IV [Patescibacteria group bacterium]MDD5715573.1 deoxyribonuclease IV [Patescibacteria group bacterium]